MGDDIRYGSHDEVLAHQFHAVCVSMINVRRLEREEAKERKERNRMKKADEASRKAEEARKAAEVRAEEARKWWSGEPAYGKRSASGSADVDSVKKHKV